MGGGVQNSTSLLEIIDQIRALTGGSIAVEWGPERLADQRWFVADTAKIFNLLGWTPKISIRDGLRSLYKWYLKRPALAEQSAIQVA